MRAKVITMFDFKLDRYASAVLWTGIGIMLFSLILFYYILALTLCQISYDIKSLFSLTWVALSFALLWLVVKINLNPFRRVKLLKDFVVLIDRHGKEFQVYPFQILSVIINRTSKNHYRFHVLIDRLSVDKKYFDGEIIFVIKDQPDGESTVQDLVNLIEQSYSCKINAKVKL